MLNKATLIDTGSSVNLASERRRISGRRFPGVERGDDWKYVCVHRLTKSDT